MLTVNMRVTFLLTEEGAQQHRNLSNPVHYMPHMRKVPKEASLRLFETGGAPVCQFPK